MQQYDLGLVINDYLEYVTFQFFGLALISNKPISYSIQWQAAKSIFVPIISLFGGRIVRAI